MKLSKEEIKFRVRKTGAFTNLITDGYEDVAEYFEQLEAENAALKKTAGELAIQLWHATPPVTTVGEDGTWIWPAKTGGGNVRTNDYK